MQKLKVYIALLLAVLLIAGSAHAVSIKGRDISTIDDVLRQARGLTGKSAPLELRKDSILRLHDDGQLDLHYSIGDGDKDLSLGKMEGYSTTASEDDAGLLAALAQTKFGGNKILVCSSKALLEDKIVNKRLRTDSLESAGYVTLPVHAGTNWFYDIYFVTLSNNEGKISQSRFGTWRYPKEDESKDSAYLKDIDTGIFIKGFDGELVVVAAMEATNDNAGKFLKFSDKKVNTRLDFWALFTNASGDVQYKKVDSLTKTESGFEAAALMGMKNTADAEWSSQNNLAATHASPYMIVRTATGDFNNDGYENEVALLAADINKIYLWIYQIEYDKQTATFTIRTIKDRTEIFSYRYPDYFRTWSYNGWNRAPGADILAGDFDGDGVTEIAAIFQGDFPKGERNAMYFGGTVKTLHTNSYKWNNSKGDLDVTANEQQDYEMDLQTPFKQKYYDIIGKLSFEQEKTRGYTRRLRTSWGGIKAVVVDIDGDGKDEIAFAGYRSQIYYKIKDTNYAPYKGGDDRHAEYKVGPYISLVKMDSDGKLKSSRILGGTIIDKHSTNYNGWDEDNKENWNAFNLQEYQFAPNSIPKNGSLYPFADREISISSGAFFGQSGTAKERGDIALRLYGNQVILFKSDGLTLNYVQTLSAGGTSALVAADFAEEGIELGRPTRIKRENDRSYMAIIQAPPYHVDTIAADGKTIVPNPTNFSFVSGAKVEYSNKDTSTNTQKTKFDMHSSVETIFAMDTDQTRNVIGGVRNIQNIYGTVKGIAQMIPGTSYFGNAVKKAKAVDGAVSSVFKFLDKLTDKVETIKQGYDNELQEQTVLKTITSSTHDTLAYAQANQYIWRYPVVTKPVLNLYTMSDDAKFLTKQDFMTFTLYDDVTPQTVLTDSAYQPTHENGNLFSYPSAVGNIEGYNYRQKVLSKQETIQFGADVSGVSDFTQIKENETTESKKVTTGYISQVASLVDGIFGTDLAKVPAGETGPTYTRKESTSERISWALPNAAASILGIGSYKIDYQAYVADNGAVTCGFAVNNFDQYRNLFNSESAYRKYSDPSFVLPNKFVLSDRSGSVPKFAANNQRMNAMEMRGVRFYAIDFNRYTTERLLSGARYRVEVPLYNASFLPANNVKVNLYWVKDRTESSLAGKNLIGTQYVNMTGWSDTGNNKAWAKFEFTPKSIPANKEGEHYQLYAVIDPDGTLAEVHEKRDLTKDSGGNNEGYLEFSVEGIESAVTAGSFGASSYAGGVKAGFTIEEWDNLNFPTLLINGEESYVDFYDKYIKDSEGPVEIELTITNNENITLPDIYLQASYQDPDSHIFNAFYSKKVVLFPNETYTTHLVLDGANAEKFRELGSQWTWIHYDIAGLFFSTEELDAGLIGDPDPELEVYSRDAKSYVSHDETEYYDSVITETYEMSNDVAVFWRIDGIADVISNPDTGKNTYVKDSAAMPAAQEEFSLSWDPSDAEMGRTASANLTISTIPGVTRLGEYAFKIQISEDGENWTDKEALIFGNVSDSSTHSGLASSSGGCDAGYSALGLMALAVMIRRKFR